MNVTHDDLALLIALFTGIAAVLTVLGTFGAKWLEHRFAVGKEKQDDTEQSTERQDVRASRDADRELAAIRATAEMLRVYASDLGEAYKTERARREESDLRRAISDELVANLRQEIAALRWQVNELNIQLARVTGVAIRTMPEVPKTPVALPRTKAREEATLEEKLTQAVGPMPNVEALTTDPKGRANGG